MPVVACCRPPLAPVAPCAASAAVRNVTARAPGMLPFICPYSATFTFISARCGSGLDSRNGDAGVLLLVARILPHPLGHRPHGRPRRVPDLLPAARYRLRGDCPVGAQARVVLAV